VKTRLGYRRRGAKQKWMTGDSITKEIERTIGNLKNNKAAGPERVPAETLKLLDKRGIAALHKHF